MFMFMFKHISSKTHLCSNTKQTWLDQLVQTNRFNTMFKTIYAQTQNGPTLSSNTIYVQRQNMFFKTCFRHTEGDTTNNLVTDYCVEPEKIPYYYYFSSYPYNGSSY